jgi:hypothetical protein
MKRLLETTLLSGRMRQTRIAMNTFDNNLNRDAPSGSRELSHSADEL